MGPSLKDRQDLDPWRLGFGGRAVKEKPPPGKGAVGAKGIALRKGRASRGRGASHFGRSVGST